MTFWDLQCFVAAAEELSFTRAAQRLYVSQQALSARVSYLESHYQAKLFERTTPLRLTPAGTYLFEHARTMLRFQDAVDSGMHSIRRSDNAVLSIGTILNRATVIIQQTVPAFQQRHPDINVRVTEVTDQALLSALQNQPFDMLICYPLEMPGISFVPIYEERYYLGIPEGMLRTLFTPEEQERLLASPTADISDYVRCPFLSSSNTTFLTDVFKARCADAGVVPQVFIESSSILTRLSLCMSGLGIMFLSKSLYQQALTLFREEVFQRIRLIPLAYQPNNSFRSIGINYLTDKGLSAAGQSFVRIAQALFREGGSPEPAE